MKLRLLIALLLTVGIGATSCEKKDPDGGNQEELITTVILTLESAVSGVETVTFEFNDLDGEGGEAPTITGGKLQANQSYTTSIQILNRSETPEEDITVEVKEEDDEHQLFYSSDIGGMSFDYLDQDGGGYPLGLSMNISTGAPGSGILKVVLKHEPEKMEPGVSEGDITNAGGSTDIDIDFPLEIE